MRLCIRLQNHGKKNHPYWWIVVAPQHKNIFGLYTDHIGFWSPRHNVNIKRQVILNVPRLKYWLANGATPTFKVHKFLTMFGIFPKQWHYQSNNELIKNQHNSLQNRLKNKNPMNK
jgi:small subunit ribosomal protein S16